MLQKKLLVLGLAAFLACGSTAVAQIATGSSQSVNGYLSIGVDSFGSWASTGFGGGGDIFNPPGGGASGGPEEAAFTSGFFLFANGTEKILLTESSQWLPVAAGPTLTASIGSPNVFSDTNGDGVDDNAVSAFDLMDAAGAPFLSVNLQQQVGSADGGVAYIRQDYQLLNTSGSDMDLQMVRAFDGDLAWAGGVNFFNNDEVGTTTNGDAFPGTYVVEREPGDSAKAITLWGVENTGAYYGGKNGVAPTGGDPAFAFGTDVQVWDAGGVPASWRNEIANVGNGVDGYSGSNPGTDGFIGLEFTANLGVGESATITVYHTYGADVPVVPEPATGLLSLLAIAGLSLLRKRA